MSRAGWRGPLSSPWVRISTSVYASYGRRPSISVSRKVFPAGGTARASALRTDLVQLQCAQRCRRGAPRYREGFPSRTQSVLFREGRPSGGCGVSPQGESRPVPQRGLLVVSSVECSSPSIPRPGGGRDKPAAPRPKNRGVGDSAQNVLPTPLTRPLLDVRGTPSLTPNYVHGASPSDTAAKPIPRSLNGWPCRYPSSPQGA